MEGKPRRNKYGEYEPPPLTEREQQLIQRCFYAKDDWQTSHVMEYMVRNLMFDIPPGIIAPDYIAKKLDKWLGWYLSSQFKFVQVIKKFLSETTRAADYDRYCHLVFDCAAKLAVAFVDQMQHDNGKDDREMKIPRMMADCATKELAHSQCLRLRLPGCINTIRHMILGQNLSIYKLDLNTERGRMMLYSQCLGEIALDDAKRNAFVPFIEKALEQQKNDVSVTMSFASHMHVVSDMARDGRFVSFEVCKHKPGENAFNVEVEFEENLADLFHQGTLVFFKFHYLSSGCWYVSNPGPIYPSFYCPCRQKYDRKRSAEAKQPVTEMLSESFSTDEKEHQEASSEGEYFDATFSNDEDDDDEDEGDRDNDSGLDCNDLPSVTTYNPKKVLAEVGALRPVTPQPPSAALKPSSRSILKKGGAEANKAKLSPTPKQFSSPTKQSDEMPTDMGFSPLRSDSPLKPPVATNSSAPLPKVLRPLMPKIAPASLTKQPPAPLQNAINQQRLQPSTVLPAVLSSSISQESITDNGKSQKEAANAKPLLRGVLASEFALSNTASSVVYSPQGAKQVTPAPIQTAEATPKPLISAMCGNTESQNTDNPKTPAKKNSFVKPRALIVNEHGNVHRLVDGPRRSHKPLTPPNAIEISGDSSEEEKAPTQAPKISFKIKQVQAKDASSRKILSKPTPEPVVVMQSSVLPKRTRKKKAPVDILQSIEQDQAQYKHTLSLAMTPVSKKGRKSLCTPAALAGSQPLSEVILPTRLRNRARIDIIEISSDDDQAATESPEYDVSIDGSVALCVSANLKDAGSKDKVTKNSLVSPAVTEGPNSTNISEKHNDLVEQSKGLESNGDCAVPDTIIYDQAAESNQVHPNTNSDANLSTSSEKSSELTGEVQTSASQISQNETLASQPNPEPNAGEPLPTNSPVQDSVDIAPSRVSERESQQESSSLEKADDSENNMQDPEVKACAATITKASPSADDSRETVAELRNKDHVAEATVATAQEVLAFTETGIENELESQIESDANVPSNPGLYDHTTEDIDMEQNETLPQTENQDSGNESSSDGQAVADIPYKKNSVAANVIVNDDMCAVDNITKEEQNQAEGGDTNGIIPKDDASPIENSDSQEKPDDVEMIEIEDSEDETETERSSIVSDYDNDDTLDNENCLSDNEAQSTDCGDVPAQDENQAANLLDSQNEEVSVQHESSGAARVSTSEDVEMELGELSTLSSPSGVFDVISDQAENETILQQPQECNENDNEAAAVDDLEEGELVEDNLVDESTSDNVNSEQTKKARSTVVDGDELEDENIGLGAFDEELVPAANELEDSNVEYQDAEEDTVSIAQADEDNIESNDESMGEVEVIEISDSDDEDERDDFEQETNDEVNEEDDVENEEMAETDQVADAENVESGQIADGEILDIEQEIEVIAEDEEAIDEADEAASPNEDTLAEDSDPVEQDDVLNENENDVVSADDIADDTAPVDFTDNDEEMEEVMTGEETIEEERNDEEEDLNAESSEIEIIELSDDSDEDDDNEIPAPTEPSTEEISNEENTSDTAEQEDDPDPSATQADTDMSVIEEPEHEKASEDEFVEIGAASPADENHVQEESPSASADDKLVEVQAEAAAEIAETQSTEAITSNTVSTTSTGIVRIFESESQATTEDNTTSLLADSQQVATASAASEESSVAPLEPAVTIAQDINTATPSQVHVANVVEDHVSATLQQSVDKMTEDTNVATSQALDSQNVDTSTPTATIEVTPAQPEVMSTTAIQKATTGQEEATNELPTVIETQLIVEASISTEVLSPKTSEENIPTVQDSNEAQKNNSSIKECHAQDASGESNNHKALNQEALKKAEAAPTKRQTTKDPPRVVSHSFLHLPPPTGKPLPPSVLLDAEHSAVEIISSSDTDGEDKPKLAPIRRIQAESKTPPLPPSAQTSDESPSPPPSPPPPLPFNPPPGVEVPADKSYAESSEGYNSISSYSSDSDVEIQPAPKKDMSCVLRVKLPTSLKRKVQSSKRQMLRTAQAPPKRRRVQRASNASYTGLYASYGSEFSDSDFEPTVPVTYSNKRKRKAALVTLPPAKRPPVSIDLTLSSSDSSSSSTSDSSSDSSSESSSEDEVVEVQ